MGLFTAAYQIGSMMEPSEEEALALLEEFEELIGEIDAIGIFLHNTSISLPMFIPGFGIGWGLFSAWSTGYAFAAIVSVTPALSEIPPLAILYASPFGLMELVAYSLGTSRSFILIHMIIKKINLRPSIRVTAIEIGIMVGLLLAGGFLEDYMIKLAAEGGFSLDDLPKQTTKQAKDPFVIYNEMQADCEKRFGSPSNGFSSPDDEMAWNDCMNKADSWILENSQ